jgi:hypothetical protein
VTALRLVTETRVPKRDQRLLQEASVLHHDLNTATEALRQALGNRDAADVVVCERRLFAIGLLFGDAVRKAGGEL